MSEELIRVDDLFDHNSQIYVSKHDNIIVISSNGVW